VVFDGLKSERVLIDIRPTPRDKFTPFLLACLEVFRIYRLSNTFISLSPARLSIPSAFSQVILPILFCQEADFPFQFSPSHTSDSPMELENSSPGKESLELIRRPRSLHKQPRSGLVLPQTFRNNFSSACEGRGPQRTGRRFHISLEFFPFSWPDSSPLPPLIVVKESYLCLSPHSDLAQYGNRLDLS